MRRLLCVSDAVGAGLTVEECEEILTVPESYDPLGICSMVQDVEAANERGWRHHLAHV